MAAGIGERPKAAIDFRRFLSAFLPSLLLGTLLCSMPGLVRAQPSRSRFDEAMEGLDREEANHAKDREPAKSAPVPAPRPAAPLAPPRPSRQIVPDAPLPAAVPLELRQPLDIRRLTASDYHAVVIAAREVMRLVYGRMTPDQNIRFEKKWTPHFEFPTAEAVAYFNKLNPLLAEFLSLREAIYRASQEFEAAWMQAMVAAAQELPAGAQEVLAVAQHQKSVLDGLNGRLAQVTAAIEALGDPPEPAAARKRGRKKHDDAVAVMRKLVPKEEVEKGDGVWVLQEVRKKIFQPERIFTFETPNRRPEMYRGAKFISTGKVEMRHGDDSFSSTYAEYSAMNTPSTVVRTADLTWSPPPKTVKWDGSFTLSCASQISRLPCPVAQVRVLGRVEFADHYNWTTEDCECSACEEAGAGNPMAGEEEKLSQSCSKTVNLQDSHWAERMFGKDPAAAARYAEHYRAQGGRAITVGVRVGPGASSDGLTRGWGGLEYTYFYRLARNADEAQAMAEARDQATGDQSDDQRFVCDPEAARREAVHFHEMNIQIIKRNIAAELEALAGERDDTRRGDLEFRIRNLRSNAQAEGDLIASIQTGQYVHTRTEADDYIQRQFVSNIYAGQERMLQAQHQVAELERLAAFLPEGEAEKARALIAKKINAGDVVKGDTTNVGPLREALLNKVEGYIEGARARQEIQAADRALFYLQAAKTGGNMATMVVFGNSAASIYAGVTNYVTDGPVEAVKQAASWYSLGGYYAAEAYDGYEKGGLLSQGGVTGAGERVGTALALNTLVEWGVPRIGSLLRGMEKAATQTAGSAARAALSAGEAVTVAEFRKSAEEGRRLAAQVRQAEHELIQARASGLPQEAIAEFERKAIAKAAAVNENYAAKSFLKHGGDPLAAQAQERLMGQTYEKTHKIALEKLRAKGYNVDELKFQEFRNASSKGSFGMDHDWGVVSKAALVESMGADGVKTVKRNAWLTRNGQAVGEGALQKDGKEAFEAAYHEATNGRSATSSFAEFTTKAHPEAFVDLNVLSNLKDPDNVRRLNAMWGEQTARTIEYKGLEMLNRADLKSFQGFQEASRGLAKELDKKVIPLISSAQAGKGLSAEGLKRTAAQFEELKQVLSAFGESKMDPVTAGRRIREITGGRDLPEILDQVRNVTEAVYKMGNLKAPRPGVLDIRVLGRLRLDEDKKQ